MDFARDILQFVDTTYDNMRGDGNSTQNMIAHLHNLAPGTFPATIDASTASSSLFAASTAVGSSPPRKSPVLSAIEYFQAASRDVLNVHDRRIPQQLRDMYKLMSRHGNIRACTQLSVVFNLIHRSSGRLQFYKDIVQLASGAIITYVPRLLPLDRGVRSVTISMDDIFNDIEYTYGDVLRNGEFNIANMRLIRPENPYLRLLRNMILESLREFINHTDPNLFKDIATYDKTDYEFLESYTQRAYNLANLSLSSGATTELHNRNSEVALDATTNSSARPPSNSSRGNTSDATIVYVTRPPPLSSSPGDGTMADAFTTDTSSVLPASHLSTLPHGYTWSAENKTNGSFVQPPSSQSSLRHDDAPTTASLCVIPSTTEHAVTKQVFNAVSSHSMHNIRSALDDDGDIDDDGHYESLRTSVREKKVDNGEIETSDIAVSEQLADELALSNAVNEEEEEEEETLSPFLPTASAAFFSHNNNGREIVKADVSQSNSNDRNIIEREYHRRPHRRNNDNENDDKAEEDNESRETSLPSLRLPIIIDDDDRGLSSVQRNDSLLLQQQQQQHTREKDEEQQSSNSRENDSLCDDSDITIDDASLYRSAMLLPLVRRPSDDASDDDDKRKRSLDLRTLSLSSASSTTQLSLSRQQRQASSSSSLSSSLSSPTQSPSLSPTAAVLQRSMFHCDNDNASDIVIAANVNSTSNSNNNNTVPTIVRNISEQIGSKVQQQRQQQQQANQERKCRNKIVQPRKRRIKRANTTKDDSERLQKQSCVADWFM